tara:strand:+ start:288 stop:470 length:183 start_codon:yes stop_codon:yes gene_type:complete
MKVFANKEHDLMINVAILKDGRGKIKIRKLGRSFYASAQRLRKLANMLTEAAAYIESEAK